MSKAVRRRMVDELAKRYEGQENFVVVDPRGLTGNQAVELRAELRKNDIRINVVKNSVAKYAFEKAGISQLTEILKEMSAVAYGPDGVAIAKTIYDFRKKYDNKPGVQGGLLEGETVGTEQIQQLSTLPSRDQLIGMFLGGMNSPVTALARTLNELNAQFVRVLKQVGEKQS